MYLYSQFPRIAIETIGIVTFQLSHLFYYRLRYMLTNIITILAIVIYAFSKTFNCF